jgi:hypothetical protein
MWAGTPHRVHVKISPPNNFTNKCFFVYHHTHIVPISALFPFGHLTLMSAPHSAAHHLPAAAIVVVIAVAAAVAIAIAINVAVAANVSSAAACS